MTVLYNIALTRLDTTLDDLVTPRYDMDRYDMICYDTISHDSEEEVVGYEWTEQDV